MSLDNKLSGVDWVPFVGAVKVSSEFVAETRTSFGGLDFSGIAWKAYQAATVATLFYSIVHGYIK